jgi:hypothetical protein
MKKLILVKGIPSVKGMAVELNGEDNLEVLSISIDEDSMSPRHDSSPQIIEAIANDDEDPLWDTISGVRSTQTSLPLTIKGGSVNAECKGHSRQLLYKECLEVHEKVNQAVFGRGEELCEIPSLPSVFVEDESSDKYVEDMDGNQVMVRRIVLPLGIIHWGRFLKALSPDTDNKTLDKSYLDVCRTVANKVKGKRVFLSYGSVKSSDQMVPVRGVVSPYSVHWVEPQNNKASAFEDIVCSHIGRLQYASLNGGMYMLSVPELGGRTPMSAALKARIEKNKKKGKQKEKTHS